MGHRLEVASYFINQGFKIYKVLKFSYIHKTTWYRFKNSVETNKKTPGRPIPGFSYTKLGGIVLDKAIVAAINEIRGREFFINAGGYIKLRYYLFNFYGYIVNKKKVYRLCTENNLLLARKRKNRRKRQISCNRAVTKPNQVWEFDIKYGYIHGENRFFYICVYIDVFSRKIIHYHIGLRCTAKNLISSFSTALKKADIDIYDGLVIRSDNGPQMASKAFYNHLAGIAHNIEHEFIPCATPNKNAHVESFYSIVELEFMSVYYFNSFKDAYVKFNDFVEHYNNTRVHSGIRYHTPNKIIELYDSGNLPSNLKIANI